MNNELADKLSKSRRTTEPKLSLFDLTKANDQNQLNELLEQNQHIKIIDTYEQQLKELFVLANPSLHLDPLRRDKEFASFRDQHYDKREPSQAGKWVHYPWRHTILHILEDDHYQVVRTGRNRNLITPEEQKKYYNSTIGIGGLSVGNSIALSLVLTGGAKHIKLADPDTLELTNLNRIRSSVTDLTEPKVHLTARQIYELDPYADLSYYTDGITSDNIDAFCDGLDVIIDEVDDLDIKIMLRQQAQQRRLPVVMATDNGDSGVIDIERYDQDPDTIPFHSRLGADPAQKYLGKKLPLPVLGKLIGEQLVGFDITEPRMQQSLLEIGQSIPTWPQLGTAALLNGVAVATAVRKILTNQPIINKRAILSLSSWLVPDYDSSDSIEHRSRQTLEFTRSYDEEIDALLSNK